MWAAGVLAGGAGAGGAQPAAVPDRALGEADAALEAYLARPALRPLLARHWAARVREATGGEQGVLADRLGRLYVELIGAAATPAARAEWEGLARELLKGVSASSALDLRMELARVVYLKAEGAAERFRLRLASAEEAADARASLADCKGQFEVLAVEIGKRADGLARVEDAGRATDQQVAEAAEARRLRSVAAYYAGWSGVYLALVSGVPAPAEEALRHFGYVLCGTPNRGPALDKFQQELLKYDHLARAAVGAALAYAESGAAAEGLRWLDLVESETTLGPELRQQLLARRVWVLARAGRWSDLERVVERARAPARAREAARPLEPMVARLLAVMAFEAQATGQAQGLVAGLAQRALQDLIARGDVPQVLDLAARFGTEGLGESGFIVHFVRGMQAYQAASGGAGGGAGADADDGEPVADPARAARFRLAGVALDGALDQPDAGGFGAERARAKLTAGRAYFRAGDLTGAAQRFEQAAQLATDPVRVEEALWLALIACERVARGAPGDGDAAARVEALATLYLKRFPQSERSATLLLRQIGKGAMSDDDAVRVLLGIGRETPVFEAARRQAARLLYKAFRSSDEADRAFAAGRFAGVAEEVLEVDRREATRPDVLPEARAAAVERGIAVARQLLDALLWGQTPDPVRAEAALEALRAMALHAGIDLGKHEGELLYRRVQIALARGDVPGAEGLAAQLRSVDPALAESAVRLFYQRALAAYRRLAPLADTAPSPSAVSARMEAARALVEAGERLISATPPTVEALREPGLQTVYRQVADALGTLYRLAADQAARDRALALDRLVLEVAPGARDSLGRVAAFAESAGDVPGAARAWNELSAAMAEGSGEWFEARYQVIRLTAEADPGTAGALLAQLAVLHPGLGPEPWRTKLAALRLTLPVPAPGGPAGAGPGGEGAPP